MPTFLIVIEKAEKNYSAYSPNLPGYIATGKTIEEVKKISPVTIPKNFILIKNISRASLSICVKWRLPFCGGGHLKKA